MKGGYQPGSGFAIKPAAKMTTLYERVTFSIQHITALHSTSSNARMEAC